MAATPESQVVPSPTPKTNGHSRGPMTPAQRLRLSAAMKAAHAKNPGAWKGKTGGAKLTDLEKRDNKIRALMKATPAMPYREIAKKLKVHVSRVYRVAQIDGTKGKKPGPGSGGRLGHDRAAVMEQRVKVRALLATGISMAAAARQLGIGIKAVELAKKTAPGGGLDLAGAGGLVRGPGGRPSQSAEAIAERGAKIQALLAEGLHPSVIGQRLGLNPATVYYWKAKAAGLDYRRGQGRVRQFAGTGRRQHAENPHAETYNWLRHAYQEIMKAVRERAYEPTVAEHYAILAYKTFGR